MLNDEQILTLWLGAFRYYLGRQTYAVSDFCELLRSQWQTLPERTQMLIKRELENTFMRDDEYREKGSRFMPLGHDCDRAEWEKVRELWNKNE
jgi:hypothetical protein